MIIGSCSVRSVCSFSVGLALAGGSYALYQGICRHFHRSKNLEIFVSSLGETTYSLGLVLLFWMKIVFSCYRDVVIKMLVYFHVANF